MLRRESWMGHKAIGVIKDPRVSSGVMALGEVVMFGGFSWDQLYALPTDSRALETKLRATSLTGGRDDNSELFTIVGALLAAKTVLVAGGPGMGKTAVATAALYDPRVATRFGRRRIFASLETATEPRTILAKLVEALGLPPTGDDATLLRIVEGNAAEQPFTAILDNAETVFDVALSQSGS